MAKKIKITCDDIDYNIETSKDLTILELALENNIDAPYSCQGGICSTCLARIVKGSVTMDDNQILTDDEVEEGLILTCQSRITSNQIEVSYDDV
jgi:ring-1,2-phenylacetyl-CoA epoxidase subunit PaaE